MLVELLRLMCRNLPVLGPPWPWQSRTRSLSRSLRRQEPQQSFEAVRSHQMLEQWRPEWSVQNLQNSGWLLPGLSVRNLQKPGLLMLALFDQIHRRSEQEHSSQPWSRSH